MASWDSSKTIDDIMTISNQELLDFNKLGFIPGPDEDEEAFLSRIGISKTMDSDITATSMQCDLYDIAPDWIPVLYSNDNLAPWHGGTTWILYDETCNRTITSRVQLRKHFRESPTFLYIYHRDEILAHEMAHICRSGFNEPRFEEFFAYNTCNNRFRRLFGPIVRYSWEIWTFIIAMACAFASTIVTLSYLPMLMPIAMILYSIARLALSWKTFAKCSKALDNTVSNNSAAVMYRMTDHEIASFASMSTKEIKEYVESMQKGSLRWRLISLAYF